MGSRDTGHWRSCQTFKNPFQSYTRQPIDVNFSDFRVGIVTVPDLNYIDLNRCLQPDREFLTLCMSLGFTRRGDLDLDLIQDESVHSVTSI